MDGTTPHEPPRHAFRRRIDDVDCFGAVEQALRAPELLPELRSGRGTARRSRVVEGFGADPSTIESSFNSPPPHELRSKGGAYGTHPSARALRQMAFVRLRSPHSLRAELHRQ